MSGIVLETRNKDQVFNRMYVYFSKILPVLVMPLSVALILTVVALVFLCRGRLRISAFVLSLSLVILWVASMPIVANMLYRSIESPFPPVELDQVPPSGCIIVLGGVVGGIFPPRVDVDLYGSVDRVFKSAELFRAGKAPIVIVSGGNQPWSELTVTEAEMIRDLLMEWGVPNEAILLEGSSRNTRENALYTKNVIDSINCESPLLVTSAAHMPRAVSAFEKVGIRVVPVSTDVQVVDGGDLAVMDFLPSAGALAGTTGALREMIGLKVYEIKGWN